MIEKIECASDGTITGACIRRKLNELVDEVNGVTGQRVAELAAKMMKPDGAHGYAQHVADKALKRIEALIGKGEAASNECVSLMNLYSILTRGG